MSAIGGETNKILRLLQFCLQTIAISVLKADIDDENRRFKEALLFGIFGLVITLQNI